MSNVNVTFQEMTAAASKLDQGEHEIESLLDALKREVENLVSGGYVTDRSSHAFRSSYDDFTTGARNVVKGLGGMSKYLHNAADTFQRADEELASRLG